MFSHKCFPYPRCLSCFSPRKVSNVVLHVEKLKSCKVCQGHSRCSLSTNVFYSFVLEALLVSLSLITLCGRVRLSYAHSQLNGHTWRMYRRSLLNIHVWTQTGSKRSHSHCKGRALLCFLALCFTDFVAGQEKKTN